ncbi:MAG: lactonase family protein [Algisphaera sp.]
MHVYFGTYTQDGDDGVFHYTLNPSTGELAAQSSVGGVANPSFLAVHPTQRFLYAAIETWPSGKVASFKIDPDTAALTLLNQQSSGGSGPCHITLNPTGTTAIVTNYSGGSVASLPVLDDGTLGPIASFFQHEGSSGVDASRQEAPHAHSALVDPSGQFVFVADLGLDQIKIYQLNAQTHQLTPHHVSTYPLHPGAGPRHLAFHPCASMVYVLNELDASLTTLAWNAKAGKLTHLQTQSTLPDDFQGRKSTAEVAVHPNGQFLYGSNRGHDSLAIYTINPTTHALNLTQHQPALGQEPRHFAIDPTGQWLIIAHQKSGSVQVFSINQATGTLTPTGDPVSVPTPVCVAFFAG